MQVITNDLRVIFFFFSIIMGNNKNLLNWHQENGGGAPIAIASAPASEFCSDIGGCMNRPSHLRVA